MAWSILGLSAAITKTATTYVLQSNDFGGSTVRISGTGFTYDAATGFLNGGSITSAQLIFGGQVVQSLQLGAALSSATFFNFFNSALLIESQVSGWGIDPQDPTSFSDTSIVIFGQNGTTARLSGFGFSPYNNNGTVTAVEHFDANGNFLATANVGLPMPLGYVAAGFGGDRGFYHFLDQGNNILTQVSPTLPLVLEGSQGNDQIIANAGPGSNLPVTFKQSLGDVTVDLSGPIQTAVGMGNDTLVGVNDISGSNFNDRITGNGVTNILFGDLGNDTVFGLGGDDVLSGGQGDDSIDGGNGNDTVFGGLGNDWLIGGDGTDLADYLDFDGTISGVVVSLAITGFQNTGGQGIDRLVGIEDLGGSQFSDYLTGNGLGNALWGNEGGDALIGGRGADVLVGGGGNDNLVGGGLASQFAAGAQWSSVASNNWASGDFNGDGKADIFRYVTGTSGAQMFLSNGTSFQSAGSWTGAGLGNQGWVVGDFNGDGKDDVMRTIVGTGSQVFLSNGSAFVGNGTWTTATTDFWVAGDFNGDGRDDIFRYVPGSSGAEMFLSTGNGFEFAGSWTGAGRGSQGWAVGDFNGDGKDDLLRTITGSGTQVLLSDGNSFAGPVAWSARSDLFRVGDFNHDGLSDVARVVGGNIEVLTSTGQGFTAPLAWGTSNVSARYLRTGDFDGTGGDDIVSYTWIAGPRVHVSTKLSGTDGSDTFVFTAASGSDTILDFVTSGPARDVLSFTTDVFSSLSEVLANATQVGADTIIRLDATDTLTLQKVTLSQLTSDNVLFV